MTTFSFNESQYRFTNPIRFFKSNDPIYYEVENIPLKQLQENDMWLKDQIFNIKLTAEGGVERQTINELRPYSSGEDSIVKVKPGRFTARINDAYNLTPLQVLKNIVGNDLISEYNLWLAKSARSPELSDILNKFRTVITSQSINLNGLVERAFSWPARIPDRANTEYLNNESPTIAYIGGADGLFGQPPYPGIGAALFSNFFDPNGTLPTEIPSGRGVDNVNYDYIIRQYTSESSIGFARLGAAETAFIKKWRGVARTAVVDVPEELSIEIPEFNPDDHFYINESGVKVNLPATQRVDLLFIYSKPVDAESATIAKYQGGSPTTITRAELGLVHGAGLGVNFKDLGATKSVEVLSPANTSKGSYPNSIDSTLPDGTIKMLSHYGDETANNVGFLVSGNLIKGSFPSPDDLMNLTPLLDEELTSSSLALIGQTILPVAYVVVKNTATFNSQGQRIIDPINVIDIRPFFRTTELSYNERAGIAAAIPAPSLANPVVTQAELDYEIKKVYAELASPTGGGGGGTGGTGGSNSLNSIPRVVARGIVCGGLNFGVESVIDSIVAEENANLSQAQRVGKIQSEYGYKNVSIPQRPAWDLARWCDIRSDLASKGEYPNDYINFHHFKIGNAGPLNGGIAIYKYAAWGNKEKNERLKRFGTQDADDWRLNDQSPVGRVYTGPTDGHVTFYFVKKTIQLDLTNVREWMGDYDVNVQYLNCFPLTSNANSNNGNGASVSDEATPKAGNAAGVWVEKLENSFTIYAAWAAKSPYWDKVTALGNSHVQPLLPPLNRNGNHFAGFGVVNTKLFGKNPGINALVPGMTGEAEVGVAIYPTIQFQVVGIPKDFAGDNVGLDLTNPTNKLVLG
jgi:hypothetical protein